MPVTGLVLLLFIIFHILDLTTGTHPVASAEYTPMTATRNFAYDNLVHSFECPWVSAFYIFAMLPLTGVVVAGHRHRAQADPGDIQLA